MKRRTLARRILRRILRIVLALVLLVVLAVGGLYLFLQTDAGRRALRNVVEGQINDAIAGNVVIGEVARFDLNGARLLDVTLYDPAGRPVVVVESIEVDLRTLDLVGGTLRVERARLVRPVVELVADADGNLNLLEAIAPREPSVEAPPEPDEPAGDPMTIEVAELAIEDASIAMLLPEGPSWRARNLDLSGRARITDKIWVEVQNLGATLGRGRQPLARIEGLRAQLQSGQAAFAALHTTLWSAVDRVTIDARATLGDDFLPTNVTASLVLSPITQELLPPLGLTDLSESMPTWVTGRLDANGPLDELAITVEVETPGGPVAVEGVLAWPDFVRVRVDTRDLLLSGVLPSLPEETVSLAAEASLNDAASEVSQIALHIEKGAYGDYAIPETRVEASLTPRALLLASLELPALGDRFRLAGEVPFDDGAYEVDLRIRRIQLERLPNGESLPAEFQAEGLIDATVRGSFQPAEEARIDADIDVLARSFRYGDLSAEELTASGSIAGRLFRPRVDLRLTTRELAPSPDFVISLADISLVGNREGYELAGNVQLRDGPGATFDLDGSWGSEAFVVGGRLAIHEGDDRLRLLLTDVAYDPDGVVTVGNLALRHRLLRGRLTGRYDFEGSGEVDLELVRLDLGIFDGRLLLPELPLDGDVSGSVRVRGSLENPRGVVALSWRDGRLATIENTAADIALTYDESAQARIVATLGGVAEVNVRGDATLDPDQPPVEALMGANYDLEVEVSARDVSRLSEIVPSPAELSGSAVVSARLLGTLDAPELSVRLSGDDLQFAAYPAVQLEGQVDMGGGELELSVRADDDEGQLLNLEGQAELGLDDLLSGDLQALLDGDWLVEAALPERPINSLDLPLGDEVAEVDAFVSLRARANSDPTPRAWVEVNLRRPRRVDVEPADEPSPRPRTGRVTYGSRGAVCDESRDLEASVRAEIGDSGTEVSVGVLLDNTVALGLSAHSAVTLTSVLSGDGRLDLEPVSLLAQLENLRLGSLPVVCETASGAVNGSLQIEQLFTDTPSAVLLLQAPALNLEGASPFRLDVEANASATDFAGHVELRSEAGGQATLDLQAPIVWGADPPVPQLGDGPLSLVLVVDSFSLAPLAQIVPPLRDGQGTVDGRIEVSGTLDDPIPRGDLTLNQVSVRVPGLGQRLRRVNGGVRLTEEGLFIENLRGQDRDGQIRIDGQVALDDLALQGAALTLRADDFPTRQDGLIIARLSTDAEVDVSVEGRRTEARVRLSDLAVRLPETSAGSVQSLERNPDIVYVEELTPGAQAAAATPEGESLAPEPVEGLIVIRLDATEPFWIRRGDFAIQMSADLTIEIEGPYMRISGPVSLRRGFLDMLGKTFELESGSVQFTGANELDPLLDITAVHELSRYPGENVTITISGRLSEPRLSFSTTLAGVDTEGEIVQLLVTGRAGDDSGGGDGDPQSDAVSFLSGLTAGLLTLTARQELGDAVPLIAVQTGDDLREVQVRAGFVADRLIPSFLSGVVTGMYIEGFLGTETAETAEGESQSTETSATGGVLIELYFPLGFLVSSTFEPPTNWSFDILWQP